MAGDFNRVILVGRLTRDAELKYVGASNTALLKASIAVNERVKRHDEWKDEASFIEFAYWGKAAEGVHKYLTKGRQIGIEGRLRQERWEHDGQSRSKITVTAEAIQLFSAPGERTQQQSGTVSYSNSDSGAFGAQHGDGQEDAGDYSGKFVDDVPF